MKQNLGRNVEASIEGDKLTLVIDLAKSFGLSKSGKTTIIASTDGNKPVGGVVLGLNAYRK
jgi:hypothetical protein